MRRKKIMIPIAVIVILVISLTLINYNHNNSYTIKQKGTLISLNVDGAKSNSFPTSGYYTANIECENAKGKWLNNEHKFVLEDISGNAVCNVSLTTKTTSDNISEIVQTKAEYKNTGGEGYRYQGINPNNYVYFNGELWRIIGYVPACFNSACTSTPSTYRVKIIRNNLIGNYTWDYQSSSYKNYWNTSSYTSTLNTLLNSKYLTSSNGTGTTGCYGYKNYPASCDFRNNGLASVSGMIESVYWGVGTTATSNTSATMFASEFSATGVSAQKVGLMSAADYGFASSSGYSSTNLSSYNSSTAAGTDWLFAPYTWMISPYSGDTTNVLNVNYTGCVSNYSAYYGFGVRPAVYLSSNVYVVSGTGTGDDPYILAEGS